MSHNLIPGMQFTYIGQEGYVNCVYEIIKVVEPTIYSIAINEEAKQKEDSPSGKHNRHLPFFLKELETGATVILNTNNQIKEL